MSHHKNITGVMSLESPQSKKMFLNTLSRDDVRLIRDVMHIGREKKLTGIEYKTIEEYNPEFPNEDKVVMCDAIAHKMQVNEYLELGMEVLGIKD